MANGINPVGFLYMTFVILSAQNLVAGKPMVPCHFIFGDSLSDNGNNNDLNTLAKANYAPYGYDFPQGPTGRFTDGRTISDIIGITPLLLFVISLSFVNLTLYHILQMKSWVLRIIFHHLVQLMVQKYCKVLTMHPDQLEF